MASIARTPPGPASADAVPLRERARGALLGLAVGDALGAPAENLKPSEIRARWGRITGYVSERPCGTDDTEYAIFSGLLLARHGSALTPAHVEGAWHQWIADRAEGPFRGAGFSERGTLENLRRGLAAPISAQHRHAWSDGLAMRAAPFGVFAAGRPGEAARLVAIDGAVSHEGEGIYGGQAVAAGVAVAMAGASPAVVIASALAVVPDDSWTARSLRRAVTVAHRGERAVRSAVVVGGYPWTDLAPEAVALAFGAYAAADGDFRQAVLTAVNMGRDADTTAAVAGALAGATRGASAIPGHWAAAIGPARGRCLPSMAGHHVLDIAELLVPEEGGKWGSAVTTPDLLPEAVRHLLTTGHPAVPATTSRPTEPAAPHPATAPTAGPQQPLTTTQLPTPPAPSVEPAEAPVALTSAQAPQNPAPPPAASSPTDPPAPRPATARTAEPQQALSTTQPLTPPAPSVEPAEAPVALASAPRPTALTPSEAGPVEEPGPLVGVSEAARADSEGRS
ncbi:ADP-ribosylglycohydrolase family protein [Streptomyces collinus]